MAYRRTARGLPPQALAVWIRAKNFVVDWNHILGEGSYGTVYRGTRVQVANRAEGSDEEVAVKVYSNIDDGGVLFRSTADLYAIMSEAGVGPRVFLTGMYDTFGVIVMRLYRYDLGSWAKQWSRDANFSANMDVISARIRVCLEQIAARNVMCVDLKPQNVLLNIDRAGRVCDVCITDFDRDYCTDETSSNRLRTMQVVAVTVLNWLINRDRRVKVWVLRDELLGQGYTDYLRGMRDEAMYIVWHYLEKDKRHIDPIEFADRIDLLLAQRYSPSQAMAQVFHADNWEPPADVAAADHAAPRHSPARPSAPRPSPARHSAPRHSPARHSPARDSAPRSRFAGPTVAQPASDDIVYVQSSAGSPLTYNAADELVTQVQPPAFPPVDASLLDMDEERAWKPYRVPVGYLRPQATRPPKRKASNEGGTPRKAKRRPTQRK